MQLEIKSRELEALIAERMGTGAFQSIEEVLLQALGAPPRRDEPGPKANGRKPRRKSLAALFADSPFKGLDLTFKREDDTGRASRL